MRAIVFFSLMLGLSTLPFSPAKALGMTMVDLFENDDLRDAARKEFEERKGGYEYKAILPDGPPPIPVKN
jgi:hypothetical protein